jgi:hypothetical protein
MQVRLSVFAWWRIEREEFQDVIEPMTLVFALSHNVGQLVLRF